MKSEGERVKEIRKTLNLTLDKFGARIGLKKNSVSQIENGINSLTEKNIKAICREFNVDYIWLTTGQGDMFMDEDFEFIGQIDQIMSGEDERRKNMIKALVNASNSDIEAFDRILDSYIEIKNQQKKKTDS